MPKTQTNSPKLKEKTQGFGKTKNLVCRKSVEKKAVVTYKKPTLSKSFVFELKSRLLTNKPVVQENEGKYEDAGHH